MLRGQRSTLCLFIEFHENLHTKATPCNKIRGVASCYPLATRTTQVYYICIYNVVGLDRTDKKGAAKKKV